jgi:uncharacterized membrane protein YfcA
MFAEGNMPPVNPLFIAAMVSGGIGGGLIGSRIVRVLGNDQVDRLFSLVLGLVILLLAYNTVRLAVFE